MNKTLQTISPKEFAFKRTLLQEIPSNNFLTHNLFSYPAKFIPHVPYYIITRHLKSGNKIILDPFAGSGTTAVEALRLGHHSINIDLNPLLNFLCKVKTQLIKFELSNERYNQLDNFINIKPLNSLPVDQTINISDFMNDMKQNKTYFFPNWKNIDHWYLPEFKELVANLWGFIYNHVGKNYSKDFTNLVKLTALYISRYFSFGARDVPKLYKSKRRKQQIIELKRRIKKNPTLPYNIFEKKIFLYYNAMQQLSGHLIQRKIRPNYATHLNADILTSIQQDKGISKKIITLANEDFLEFIFPDVGEFVDAIITSPPYVYAQEYIRSTKLDLYWLNCINDSKAREIAKRELGAKNSISADEIKTNLQHLHIFSSFIEKIEKIEDFKYRGKMKYSLLVLNYFHDMYNIILQCNSILKTNGIFGFFIGNPSILGEKCQSNRIFYEIFENLGYHILEYGYDEIISRQLLQKRKNPSPQGMNAEWLIIAKKS
ncbi:MAG: DNA methyltransferase [Candidatus Hodarchaeales archaeon]